MRDRKKFRLSETKWNRKKRKVAKNNMRNDRKRRQDVNVIVNCAETTKIKNVDNDLWNKDATKVVDSEREKKRHKDNE